MGNRNSGRWNDHTKMRLIEDAYYLDISRITQADDFCRERIRNIPVLQHSGQVLVQPEAKIRWWREDKAMLSFIPRHF